MTDLHCHILPSIDDGARDVESAIKLLYQEKEQGINRIVFTPHFDCTEISLDKFLEKRQKAYDLLISNLPDDLKEYFEFKLGAEVFFTPALKGVEVEKLCFEGTRYLLVELPFTTEPQFLKEILFDFGDRGITPIIAHVERYSYAASNPVLLYDWVQSGFCIQMNAETLKSKSSGVTKLLLWDLVQIMASDAHSEHKRPVEILAAQKALDKELALKLSKNADAIFENEEIITNPYCPKKTFFGWR